MASGLRIAYPVSWHRPDTKASCEQTVQTVAALARLGHCVTLFAPTPAGAAGMTAPGLLDRFALAGDFDVVPVTSRWAGESLVAGLGWLRQLRARRVLERFDMLFCRLPALIGLGRSLRIPFAFDHYRPWPDIYPLARPFIRRAAAAPNCVGLVLHSQLAADSYRRAGVAEDRLLVAHNGSHAGPPIEQAEARRTLRLDPSARIVLYAGRVNAEKGLDQLLAMARLRPAVRFVIVGSEGEGPIETLARRLANVTVVPWQTPQALPAYLAAADVLLIPPSSEPLRRFGNCVLPLKTFSYLAASRPILAPALPDTAELLRDGETALLVEPDDPTAACGALDRLLGQRDLAARLGAGARLLAEANSWDARAGLLTGFFDRRLGEIAAAAG